MAAAPAKHEDAPLRPVAAETIATWPVGSFLENIVATQKGGFAISLHNKREIHYVARDGTRGMIIKLPASPAGLIVAGDDLFAVAGEPGVGPHRLFRVAADGTVEMRLVVEDSLFLNGFTPAKPGRAYCVDSIIGVVIEIDLVASTSRVVLRDNLLRKNSDDPVLPGANGIKCGDDALFITNTDRALVLRAPLGADGPTGEIEVLAEGLRGDDLALGANGDLFITNHFHNTLTRLGREGNRVAIAGPAEGMAGCTACVFGDGDDATNLYVTTTGGMILPLDGIVQEAKQVRLAIGVAGRPIGFMS